MRRTPKVIVPATEEFITLERARLHLRVDGDGSPAEHPDDVLITSLIKTARLWAEKYTGQTISPATLELALDEFPGQDSRSSSYQAVPTDDVVTLPKGPVRQILSFLYADGTGADQEITDYQLDTHSKPPRLAPAAGVSWPAARTQLNAVRIRYLAGYAPPGESPDDPALPEVFVQAMLLCIGHWYDNREDASVVKLESIPLGARALLADHRIESGLA
jgi:uncharacterized phiE125 gp8 family phage protein